MEICEGNGLPSGFAKINTITSDIAVALEGAEIVIVAVLAYAEARAAKVCAPYLKKEQGVYLSSGYMYGNRVTPCLHIHTQGGTAQHLPAMLILLLFYLCPFSFG